MSFPCVHPQHDAHQSNSLKNNGESWLMVHGEQKKCKLHAKITCPELYLQERLLFSTRSWKHRRCEFSVRDNKKKFENWTSLLGIIKGKSIQPSKSLRNIWKSFHLSSNFILLVIIFLMLSIHLQSGDSRNTKGCWKLPVLSEKLHNAPV